MIPKEEVKKEEASSRGGYHLGEEEKEWLENRLKELGACSVTIADFKGLWNYVGGAKDYVLVNSINTATRRAEQDFRFKLLEGGRVLIRKKQEQTKKEFKKNRAV